MTPDELVALLTGDASDPVVRGRLVATRYQLPHDDYRLRGLIDRMLEAPVRTVKVSVPQAP